MIKKHLKRRSREEGSVLLFAVVVILFLATLSLFFRSATSPVFTHHHDARRTLQAEYMMASAVNVLKAELLAIPNWSSNKNEIKTFLNDYKKIELVDGQKDLGYVRWVQEFNYTAGQYQVFEVVESPDGQSEIIRFTKSVGYQIKLDDNTRAVRKIQMQVSRDK